MIDAIKHIEYLSDLKDFETYNSLKKLDEEEILTLLQNYDELFKHRRLARRTIEYIAENRFETFARFARKD